MNIRKIIAIILILTILSYSCTSYSGLSQTSGTITIVNKIDCEEKSNTMHTFFQGENIDFNYQKIGLVEVEGDRVASDTEIIDYMKYYAWDNCANALINIEKDYITRELTYHYSDHDEQQIHNATLYRGLAVKIDKDATFMKKYGDTTDLDFVQIVSANLEKDEKSNVAKKAIGSVLLVGLIVFGLYGAVSQSED